MVSISSVSVKVSDGTMISHALYVFFSSVWTRAQAQMQLL